MRRGLPWLSTGGVILLLEGAEHFFGIIQSLDFLKTKFPEGYRILTSPTINTSVILGGAILILVGLRKTTSPGPTGAASVSTRGSRSPAQQIDRSPGTQVAGGNIINQYSGAPLSAGKATRPEKSKPNLIMRGIASKAASFPYWDQSRTDWRQEALESQALIIRNDAESSEGFAHRLVAHLDFQSDEHGSRSINEGWWAEDGAIGASNQLDIGRSETKHLLIAAQASAGTCLTVGKVWDGPAHRYLPDDVEELKPGPWRLIVEIRGDNIRLRYYISGVVEDGGTSRWAKPLIQRPSDWPPEPAG